MTDHSCEGPDCRLCVALMDNYEGAIFAARSFLDSTFPGATGASLAQVIDKINEALRSVEE